MCFNTLKLYLLWMLKSTHLCPVGAYSSWFLSPFTGTPEVFEIFLASLGHFQLIFPPSDLASAHLQVLVPLSGNWY